MTSGCSATTTSTSEAVSAAALGAAAPAAALDQRSVARDHGRWRLPEGRAMGATRSGRRSPGRIVGRDGCDVDEVVLRAASLGIRAAQVALVPFTLLLQAVDEQLRGQPEDGREDE